MTAYQVDVTATYIVDAESEEEAARKVRKFLHNQPALNLRESKPLLIDEQHPYTYHQ